MNAYSWYSKLRKPSWAPPPGIFGPVWTLLYLIIIVSFGSVFVMAVHGDLPRMIALPFILNLVANLLFTTLQFRLRNTLLASVDILAVLGTLLWAMAAVYPHVPWIAYAQIPYLLWVAFATVLQLTVTYLNS